MFYAFYYAYARPLLYSEPLELFTLNVSSDPLNELLTDYENLIDLYF